MKKKIYWLAVLFFLIDLISKQVIIRIIDLASSIKIIPNFFYLTYVRNEGAAFSIFENQQILILLVTFFALFFINNYLTNQKINKIESFSYSLITGGILGNLFDRIVYGYVIDFLDFRFGSYHYPVFNLADTFIVIGVITLMIYSFYEWRKNNGNKKRSK